MPCDLALKCTIPKINKGTVLFSATDPGDEVSSDLIELGKDYIKTFGLTSEDVRLYKKAGQVVIEAKEDFELLEGEEVK